MNCVRRVWVDSAWRICLLFPKQKYTWGVYVGWDKVTARDVSNQPSHVPEDERYTMERVAHAMKVVASRIGQTAKARKLLESIATEVNLTC